MTLKQMVEAYKGDIEIVANELVDGEAVEIVSFNASEFEAIKDEITGRNVSKFEVVVTNKIPAIAKIVVILASA